MGGPHAGLGREDVLEGDHARHQIGGERGSLQLDLEKRSGRQPDLLLEAVGDGRDRVVHPL